MKDADNHNMLNLPERTQASNLERVTQRELDDAIKKHELFLKGVHGGARASFKFRDLSQLDFRKADLSQADFTGSVLAGTNFMSAGVFKGVTFFLVRRMRNANIENCDCSAAPISAARSSPAPT